MLAARVVQEQGVHVEGLNFFTGFCVEGHTHAIRKRDQEKAKRNNALWVAEEMAQRFALPYWQFTLSASNANSELRL